MIILGSTGSIGTQSLQIATKFGIEIEALAARQNIKLLNEQIAKFAPKFVYIEDKNLISQIDHRAVFFGKDGIEKMLCECQSQCVINALVGFAGLMPSFTTQRLGKTLCLANKESLVVGGRFLNTKAIHPIDSEHFGLKFLLKNHPKIARLVITASGGAFRDTPLCDLANATCADALRHPNWQMGAKITIDSATMANKLFEILEAFWLYDTDKIDAFIERSSVIHALVHFIDGSTTAHISRPDMRLAIAHAIKPDFSEEIAPNFDLLRIKNLNFEEINLQKYPVFTLKNDLLRDPNLGVIINAANEIFVEKFLRSECGFLACGDIIKRALDRFSADIGDINCVMELEEIDKKVREFCR